MIVSLNWLCEYLDGAAHAALAKRHDELVDRLTMSGLNHEGTEPVGDDQAIDLEVTSNRADCLGHIGVAREVSVLLDIPLSVPDPQPVTGTEAIDKLCNVEINSDKCFRYTARLVKGVKIGPSPDWMVNRLAALGIESINNVVDITNYVMFECGQPLHAYDFAKLDGGKIIVRNANEKEEFLAIDHKTYPLDPAMCMIADAKNAVAIGGVMGGADSEISDATTDVLVEAAYFDQLSVRKTARQLNLHSPSAFRFERDVDSAQLDWASRRCCELILELAGGTLCEGMLDVGQPPAKLPDVTLRFAQLKRVLGIEIPADVATEILSNLGLSIISSDKESVTATAPSWRKDLTREVDLVEEVGRIYGFDKVPDDALVPMAASMRPKTDRVVDKIRNVMTSAGFDEAMTATMVPEKWATAFSPWTDQQPIISSQPMLGVLEKASRNIGAVSMLRRSLVPSLIEARRINEFRGNDDINLFETAKVYLHNPKSHLPDQPTKLAIVSGMDFFAIKGIVETIVAQLSPKSKVVAEPCSDPLFDPSQSANLSVDGKRLGLVGKVSASAQSDFRLRSPATVAEIDIAVLESLAVLIPIHENQSQFQPMSRDFNFIVENEIHWSDLENTILENGGQLIESIDYRETFRDPKKDGENKKRLLLSIVLRSATATLTGEEAEVVCKKIIGACEKSHGAVLLG